MTPRRALLVLPVAASVIAAAVIIVLTSPGESDQRLLQASAAMETQLLRQAIVAEGPSAAVRFDRLSEGFDLALVDGLAAAPKGSRERVALLALADMGRRWRSATARALLLPGTEERAGAAARAALVERFVEQNASLQAVIRSSRDASGRVQRRTMVLFSFAIALLAAAAAGLAAARAWRRYTARVAGERRLLHEDRRHRGEQEEFARALQGARSEREAQRMLKRQLERSLDESSATVLNRNNSRNRLEAVTALRADSPLAEIMPEAEPDDCLAVRFGQPNSRAAGSSPLLACELCGALEGSVTCVPSLVGGEVIGSVLVQTPTPLDQGGQRRLSVAVGYAAPVLASMRNLKLAETRAATDALTGLANRRSAEETLGRSLAMASRTATPCAVVSFDLDHFKQVNDVYGHDKGDQLLAAVADTVSASVRASDFVARFGGEEFLVILPDTELDGALLLCEKLRAGVAALRISGVGQSPSASFGIAVFPTDGEDPETLLRGADRALYAAKEGGRNCVKALRVLDDPVTHATEAVV